MKPSEIKQLQIGDKVWWNDPEGLCSRFYTVKRVKFHERVVTIEEADGSVLECPADELTKNKSNK